MNKKGFTLIELLVVISIIALLLSILMPSLQKVKELSRRVVCSSNMKQIGLGFSIHSNDNKDYTTPDYRKLVNGNYVPWDALLAPYFSTDINDAEKKFFVCSSDKQPRKFNAAANIYNKYEQALPRSYSVNACLQNISDWYASADPLTHKLGGNGSDVPAKYSQVKHASKVIHVMELHLGYDHLFCRNNPASNGNIQGSVDYQDWLMPSIKGISYNGQIDSIGNAHSQGANWLLVDGHVNWHTANDQAQDYYNSIAILFNDLKYPDNWLYR